MTYAEKLKDPRWQKKRLEVMESAGFKCEDCSSSANTLHVHHCHYVHRRNPWEYRLGLICVCDQCHKERQEMEQHVHVMIALKMRFMKPRELARFSKSFCTEVDSFLRSRGINP